MQGFASIGAVTVNPASGSVLATTGPLISGSQNLEAAYRVEVFVSSTVGTVFALQTLTSATGSVVAQIYINTPAVSSQSLRSSIAYAIADGLVLRVVNVPALTGTVQANIFWAIEEPL